MYAAFSHCRGSERGAALVLALLIAAVVAGLAVDFAYDYQLNFSRVEYRAYGSQAREYVKGAEALAAVILETDAENSEADHLAEEWARDIAPFPTDHGTVEAELEDAQGRFNLNSLAGKVDEESEGLEPAERFTPEQRRFIRLLQTFEEYPVSPDEAIAITEAVVDWVDEDDDTFGFGGAETLYYSRRDPPYEPANQAFSSVSELRLVRHITPELYRHLEPLLTVLPADAGLNVNTALPPLLRTINEPDNLRPLSSGRLTELVEDRELQQYETLDDFFSSPVIQDAAPNAVTTNAGYTVASNWFLLHARAAVDEQLRYLLSVLERRDSEVSVARRRYTSY